MSGVVLRLAGPLQSWGEHSAFSVRDTLRFPTRSGIIGMFASAQGIGRGKPLNRYVPLTLTVRVDRPGTLLQDYHTTGGGLPHDRTVPTASGGLRGAEKETVITRRWYLSDAVFTVAAEGPDSLIREIAAALRAPRWQPYLGRRSCPPDQPLLLCLTSNPVADLRQAVPLPRRRADRNGQVTVDMITETPARDAPLTEVSDIPDILGRYERRYRIRDVYQAVVQVPAALASWRNAAEYHKALHDYARRTS
jgi:CRISPR system Cascade subunit CasD